MKDKNACNIIASATAVPPNPVTTPELITSFGDRLSEELVVSLRHLGVENRNSIVANFASYLTDKITERKLISSTSMLGVQAAEKCIAMSNIDPSQICALIAMTNTSDRHLPCFGYEVASKLSPKIPVTINIINMQDQGCSVLLKAAEVAQQYLHSFPNKYVLVVAAEGHTGLLSKFQNEKYCGFRELKAKGENDQTIYESMRLIEAFLFGDGAIAMLLGLDENYSSLVGGAHTTNIEQSDLNVIHMDEGGVLVPAYRGFPHYVMSPNVPIRGAMYAEKVVKLLFSQSNTSFSTVSAADYYLIHTGSKKILTGICETLKIDPLSEKVANSFAILNNFGNLSSASIGFMIDKCIKEKKQGNGLLVSFGVGFSGSAGFIQFR